MLWCRLVFVHFFIVFASSELLESENHEGPAKVICNTECNQLQNRLATIEAAVRTIVSAVSSQTNDLFAPIKEIFQQDPFVRSILSLNYTSSIMKNDGNMKPLANSIFKNNTGTEGGIKGNSNGNLLEKNTAVDNLKGAVKCSLAQLVDIKTIDFISSPNMSFSDMTASLINESLEITWPIISTECLKFSSGVWIRVYQQNSEYEHQIQPETSFLYVPQKCLKKKSKTSYSVILFPPSSSSSTGKKNGCLISLTRNLIQCRAYVVEVIPNYQSLRGKTLRTEIVVPPKVKRIEESNFKSLISVVAHSNTLMLNWEDNSGCAPQLTSFSLKIFEDGIVDDEEKTNMTVTIPRNCLKRSIKEENLFSLVLGLPANHSTCPVEWKPLDRCRKYRIDMSSQYSGTWNGPSSSWEIFTGQKVVLNPTTDSISDSVWRCQKYYYWCNNQNYDYGYDNRGCTHISNYICDGENHCINGIDEKYCDQTLCNNKDGFKCQHQNNQCIPKELVCDGKYDCLDGSDEVGCNMDKLCEHLTSPSGHFPSQMFSKPAFGIHSDRTSDAFRETIVLISVQPNHQIWLTFDKFATYNDVHFVNVYDGPYSTSPLLLSYSGSTIPPSIRSSSNELFVEFPSYYDKSYGIEGSYTSVNSTDELFKRGCGGYMNGEGKISTPNYFSETDIADCFWLIEARKSEDLILLRINSSADTAAFLFSRAHPKMIVYDGWSKDGLVLYDTKSPETQGKVAIYSISNKMMIHFKPSTVKENQIFYWDVSKISTPLCKNSYEGASGTVKSPNYPMLYPHLTDCRWTISVAPGSKVRLLFAFFETQEGADFIWVYDGPTVHAKLLLTESGTVPTPFVINSSTNQVLVRFTSDRDTSFSGFLAVYSSF